MIGDQRPNVHADAGTRRNPDPAPPDGPAAGSRIVAWAPAAIAAGGGLVWAACFEREPFLVLPWVALAPLLLAITRARTARGAFGLGWLHGTAFWLAAIPWIQPTLVTYGGLAAPLAWALVAGLAVYLGLYQGLFAWLVRPLLGGRLRWALAGVPAAWVATEWLQGRLAGFPWNMAAYAWIEVPGALPFAAWIGPHGVSWLLVLSATGVALAVARRRFDLAAVGVLVPLALLPMAARWSGGVPQWGRPAPAVVLQPNIPNLTAWDPVVIERNLATVMRMTEEACALPGTLVVWPESAAWPYAWGRDPGFTAHLADLQRRRGCRLLLNSAQAEAGRTYNSALLLEPDGAVSRYDKRHLVPFGEFVPFADLLPFVGRLARAAGDFTAADTVRLLPWGDERIGTAICFEIVFADEVAELVDAGATVLVTITNDAWYGDTAAPWQHLRAARFRAAENRRPLLRAAITGVSAVVDARGAVVSELGVNEQGALRVMVAGRTDLSPYARRPALVPGLAFAVVGLAIISGLRRRPQRAAAVIPSAEERS